MLTADAVEVYELLKPKVGEQEAKSLLRFIEDRTIHLVREEIAKGLATKADITELKEDIADLKKDIIRLEKEILTAKWQTRVYLVAIGALILLTNPKVLDLLGKLVGLVP